MSMTYIKARIFIARRLLASGGLAAVMIVSSSGTVSAIAAANPGASATAVNQQHLQNIITKGDQEINRRLASLGTLTAKINGAAKLSPNDKTDLTNEVTTETASLTSLKTKLDADTDLATAKTDAQSIIDEYRVYALVVPKVALIKVADDQQATEAKLTALATKLQTALTSKKTAGKDVTSLQTQLTDMTSQTAAASTISTAIESGVIGIQPTDYNSNHTVLSGDYAQLKTAHADNQAAYADAQSIAIALKSL